MEEFGGCSTDSVKIPERFLIEEEPGEYSTGGPADLVAWRRAMDLTRTVYVVTRTWPSDERFGLTSQVGRSAVSVPANIAEGHGRSGHRNFSAISRLPADHYASSRPCSKLGVTPDTSQNPNSRIS